MHYCHSYETNVSITAAFFNVNTSGCAWLNGKVSMYHSSTFLHLKQVSCYPSKSSSYTIRGTGEAVHEPVFKDTFPWSKQWMLVLVGGAGLEPELWPLAPSPDKHWFVFTFYHTPSSLFITACCFPSNTPIKCQHFGLGRSMCTLVFRIAPVDFSLCLSGLAFHFQECVPPTAFF